MSGLGSYGCDAQYHGILSSVMGIHMADECYYGCAVASAGLVVCCPGTSGVASLTTQQVPVPCQAKDLGCLHCLLFSFVWGAGAAWIHVSSFAANPDVAKKIKHNR